MSNMRERSADRGTTHVFTLDEDHKLQVKYSPGDIEGTSVKLREWKGEVVGRTWSDGYISNVILKDGPPAKRRADKNFLIDTEVLIALVSLLSIFVFILGVVVGGAITECQ